MLFFYFSGIIAQNVFFNYRLWTAEEGGYNAYL